MNCIWKDDLFMIEKEIADLIQGHTLKKSKQALIYVNDNVKLESTYEVKHG